MVDRTEAQAASKVESKRAQLRFERLLASYIHPQRLGDCLPPNLPVSFRDKLLGSRRLQPRLSGLLTRRFRLPPCMAGDFETPEGWFAQLEGQDLGMVIRRIGAVWHGRSIAAIILANPLKELIAWLGRDGHRSALRHIALAGVGIDQEIIGDKPNIDLLCQVIERDGQRCVSAWCRHQTASLATRLLLKLPPVPGVDDEPLEPFREQGLLITDRVIMDMVAGDGNGS